MAGQQTFNSVPQSGEGDGEREQRGAKSAAQYGTAHQNASEVTRTPVINASAAQN